MTSSDTNSSPLEHPMTDAPPLASEQITQEDREAAHRLMLDYAGDNWRGLLKGEEDRHTFVQAFARHRIAALSASPAPSGQGVSGADWDAKLAELYKWTGSDWLSGGEEGPTDRTDLRVWLCTLIGWFMDASEAAPAPSCAPGGVEQINGATMPDLIWLLDLGGGDIEWSDTLTPDGEQPIGSVAYIRAERCAAIAADHADQNEDTSVGRARNQVARDIADELRSLAALSPAPGATAQDGVTAFVHRIADMEGDELDAHASVELRDAARAALAATPTIPAGMVAEVDRNHAADLMSDPVLSGWFSKLVVENVRGGQFDTHPFVEAFVAHRLAAAPKQAEQQGVEEAIASFPRGWKVRQVNLSAPCADDRKWHVNVHGGHEGGDTFVGRGASPALALRDAADAALAALNALTGAVEKGEGK